MIKLILALFALALFTLALPIAASAKDVAGVVPHQVAPATLRQDSAYLLVRVSTAKSGLFPIQPVLLRIPTSAELDAYRTARAAAYDKALPDLVKAAKGAPVPGVADFAFDYDGPSNSFVVDTKAFLEDGELRTILLEVPVGSYVLYGITLGNRGLVTCNCLGTVRFAARGGVITHVGSIFADKVHKPSPLPHLEDNLGQKMFQYSFIFGQALVPADTSTPVPQGLRSLGIEPARFEVVGEYYEPGAGSINRLAPIPGLLGYDRGRPVDLRTQKAAD